MTMKSAIPALKKVLGGDAIITDRAGVDLYSFDSSMLEHPADCVVFPSSTEEVAAVLKIAEGEEVPVVPRGAGSGRTGGSVPIRGGIVLCLARMNRILEIDRGNLICRAEAGTVTGAIASAVAEQGLYYPPDPASLNFCTIGGNVAHNAGGLHALKYGVTKNWVIGMTAVLPGGEVLKTGVRTVKGVVGYDLTKLICGSEGTLAVVTEVTLRLIPKPANRAVLVAPFPTAVDAGEAVSEIIAARVLPAALEFMDGTVLKLVEDTMHLGFPREAGALLLVELDGHPEAVKAELATVEQVVNSRRAMGARTATTNADCERLWEARRTLSPLLGKLSPRRMSEDITVPRSRIPEALAGIEAIGRKYGIPVASFGHAGDGNLHVNLMADQADPSLQKVIEEAVEDTLRLALALGGTLSGEHGVALAKQKYIGMELGPLGMALQRNIKKLFDPKGILNPGKIFPPENEGGAANG